MAEQITSVAVVGGTLDPDFWPGLGGAIATYVRGLETLGLDLEEAIQGPDEGPNIGGQDVVLIDLGGQVTSLLASQSNAFRTNLRATVSDSDATILVDSVAGVPTHGVLWLEREAIAYTSVTASPASFNGCTRGLYGSAASAHNFSLGGTSGSTVRVVPVVWSAIPHLLGRRLTRWVGEIVGTVLTNPSLMWDGRIAPGSTIGGNADGAEWKIHAEHAWTFLSQTGSVPNIDLAGYSHNRGFYPESKFLTLQFLGLGIFLQDTATTPDNLGWHPDLTSFPSKPSGLRADLGILRRADHERQRAAPGTLHQRHGARRHVQHDRALGQSPGGRHHGVQWYE